MGFLNELLKSNKELNIHSLFLMYHHKKFGRSEISN